MGFVHLLKGKLVVALLAGVALVGGGTAVFAATPAGHQALQAITSAARATVTPDATEQDHNTANNACPGLADAQRLAKQFGLSTASDGDAVQAICALHKGTFKDTSGRVFGYGEIEQLLTYAQYLASHDQANQDGKLTTDNARGYLAEALQNCGTTPLESCLKTKISGYQPGNGNGNNNGNGGGKPASTPTPPGNGGKPESTPTPHN